MECVYLDKFIKLKITKKADFSNPGYHTTQDIVKLTGRFFALRNPLAQKKTAIFKG